MQFYIGSRYRIVCTEQEPYGVSPLCARIINVGVGEGGDSAQFNLRVDEVVNYLSQGVLFYTKGLLTGKVALVQSYYCSKCRGYHIRSAADATKDNNLDYLRVCSWKKAA